MDAPIRYCFHCADALPAAPVRTAVDGHEQVFCCHGCAAAAAFIRGAGLDAYYRLRSAPGNRPADDDWSAYDRPALDAELVHRTPGRAELTVQLEGVRCAACTWLIERALGAEPGVLEVQVNPVAARARLVWSPERTRLSVLLTQLAALGYRPHPGAGAPRGAARRAERRGLLTRMAVAGLGSMQAMMYGGAQWLGVVQDMTPEVRAYLSWVGLVVTTPVVLWSAQPFLAGAWRTLAHRRLGMDVSIALAVLLAYGASVLATLAGAWPVYYDALSMFVFLLLTGRYLELAAREQAVERTDALARLLPATARRLTADGGLETVGRSELAPGDRVQVAHGEPVPSDAVLEDATAELDEALLTGESGAVHRRAGEELTGGALNLGQPFAARVTRVGSATVVAGIVRLLDRAQAERPALALAAERVAGWFVAGVLVAAALTWWLWQAHDPAQALTVTLAVLIATCPCALGLATPAALTAATHALAHRGLLVTRAHTVETLARVTDVVFDKTGTLTVGRPQAQALDSSDPARALAIASALEVHTTHPLARAFSATPPAAAATDVSVVRGAGVEGTLLGRRYRLGRADWVTALSGATPADPHATLLGDATGTLARFEFDDALRGDAGACVSGLIDAGVRVHLASGDAPARVAAVATALGIHEAHAAQDPAAKLALVRGLQAAGRVVLVVGDGVNDAPVLAGADVAVAVDRGSALAQASADAVLLGEHLAPLVTGLALARRTRRVVHQNLAWALGYNLLVLPVAMAGWLAPWLAALGMSLSSLAVVGNALRLGRAPRPGAT